MLESHRHSPVHRDFTVCGTNNHPRNAGFSLLDAPQATVLVDETTHATTHVNRGKDIPVKQVENWKETRLLIIDEVSFAAPRTLCQAAMLSKPRVSCFDQSLRRGIPTKDERYEQNK